MTRIRLLLKIQKIASTANDPGRSSGIDLKAKLMTKSIQNIFKELLRNRIAPALRDLGFKGSGQKFSLPIDGFWASLAFQKSLGSDAASLNFTINLTVVSKAAWETLQREQGYRPASPPSGNTRYGRGVWQSRIGSLMPKGQDYWWTLEGCTDVEAFVAKILTTISSFALPAMHEQVRTQSEL